MKAKDLRSSILQLAISGKLVPQNPDDEPASVLLAKIRAEKAKLVKEGKIKKQKPLPPVTEDEKPFDIPDSWVWVRLGEISYGVEYGTSAKSAKTGEIPVIRMGNLQNGIIDWTNLVYTSNAKEIKQYSLHSGDVLFNRTNSRELVGKTSIYQGEQPAIFAGYLVRVNQSKNINSYYLNYFLNSYYAWDIGQQVRSDGINQSNINGQKLCNFIFPLPPLAEQQRISAKIKELMPLVKDYDKAETELSALNETFPQDLRKSLLQYAVEGKLVPQDPNDEPASVLLEKIRAEKAKLVKEGKIKPQKPLPPITEDEKPFDIPNSWAWVRLRDIASITGGGTPKSSENLYWDHGNIAWVTPADLGKNRSMFISSGERNITSAGLSTSSAQLLAEGTVVFSSRAPIGYIAIAANNLCTNQGCKSATFYINKMNIFFYYVLIQRTPDIIARASGTTFKEISGEGFAETIVPLPPLAEQKRIVAKLEQLLPYCGDKLFSVAADK